MSPQITEIDPVAAVYALLGLTETNGGMDLVPPEDVERALMLYPQNLKYAASSIAMNLANQAAMAADPQQFSLQGVMSVAWHDPAAHWRSVAKFLQGQADSDYNRDRQPANAITTQLQTPYDIEEGHEYAPHRKNAFRKRQK